MENSYTISIDNCVNIHIEDVAIKYAYSTLFRISNSAHVDLVNCDAFYSAIAMGIQYNNSDGNMSGCTAIGNGYDGFNFHDYGYTEMINCKSLYNFDDGCSHHEGCNGLIIGGEFVGNVKGGITPAYGAHVNIFNIFARDNDHYGIGYLSSSNHRIMHGMMNGCTLVNNPVGLAVGTLASVIAINTIFSNNTIDKQINGTLEEY